MLIVNVGYIQFPSYSYHTEHEIFFLIMLIVINNKTQTFDQIIFPREKYDSRSMLEIKYLVARSILWLSNSTVEMQSINNFEFEKTATESIKSIPKSPDIFTVRLQVILILECLRFGKIPVSEEFTSCWPVQRKKLYNGIWINLNCTNFNKWESSSKGIMCIYIYIIDIVNFSQGWIERFFQ